MTKFPLSASTFPTLELPQKDIDEIEALSSLLVERTLIQYHEHEVVRRGVVDTTRWKKVTQREDIKVFKERASAAASSSTWSPDAATNSYGSVIPMLMSVGTISGDLFDVMYGVLSPTTEVMRIKSLHDEDGLLDCRVLATLINPSAEDPLRSLTLRWAAKGSPLIMTPVVRNRDVVYMESTGIAYTKSGERIGYQLLHSVEVPGVPEFVEHQLVRAELSYCYIYRQKTAEIVDVFMRGVLDPRGGVPSYIGAISTAEALVAVSASAQCAEMKKLTWLLRTSKADPPSTLPDTSHCAVCLQATRLFNFKSMMKYSCAVCLEQICSKCCVTRKISYISPLNFNEVLQTKFPFCVRCVERALAKSAIEIATEEASDPSLFNMSFGAMADIMSAPTSFSSTSSMAARTAS
uniref:FYVE-type domain-containing protein n=1 Tax=Globisporangium ultimum (strain ATCC 200006 / CBS 805.95 / DAOM BR144) TaxID=431595 RepID=K3W6C5_GLOUD